MMKKIFVKINFLLVFLTYGVLGMAKTQVVATLLHAPTGIAFNREGEMLVTNWSANSIVKITQQGKQEVIYSGINTPAGIIVDLNNNIYVASYQDNYILKIDSNDKASKIASSFHTQEFLGQIVVTY